MSHLEEMKWLLPDELYGVVGTELNVYFDSVFYSTRRIETYEFDVHSSLPADANAQHAENRWTMLPTDANIGSGAVTFECLFDGVVVLSKTVTVTILPRQQPEIPRQLLVIGDSMCSNGYWLSELQHIMGEGLVTAGTNLIQQYDAGEYDALGQVIVPPTQRPIRHQSVSGRTVAWFWGDHGTLPGKTPFAPTGGIFDFAWYLANQNVTLFPDDWLFINLGTNDIHPYTNDADAQALMTVAFSRLEQMVCQIQTAVPGIKIGIGVIPAPAISQDAWGKIQDSRQTRWRYARNRMLWAQQQFAQYGGREAENIYIVPIHAGLDIRNNMYEQDQRANARNGKAIRRQYDNLHPARSGHHQFADAVYPFLLAHWE